MAKIYETQADFERDKLKDQANRLHMQALSEGSSGLSALLFSWIARDFHRAKPETRGWASWASMGLLAYSVFDIVKSWFTASKAHSLQLEGERLGPETVVIPPDVNTGIDDLRLYTDTIAPKSHSDYAEKDCGCKFKG